MALATNALTRVSTVEDELGIASGTEDARLQRMINVASAAVESYTGREFYRDTAISETVRTTEGPYMFLSRPPINSITSISFLGSALSLGDYEIHSANSGIVYAINGSWAYAQTYYQDISRTPATGMERKAHTVVYDGGYYTPKQEDDGDGTRNLPYDIEQACILLVSFLRRGMGRDPSIRAESLLGGSVNYTVGGDLVQAVPFAATLLSRFRLPVLR